MKTILILCDALRYDRVTPKIMPNIAKLSKQGCRFTMFFANGGTTKWSIPHFLSGKREYDPLDNFPNKLTKNNIHNSIIHSNAVLCSEKYQDCFKQHHDLGVEMSPVKATIRNKLKNTDLWKLTRGLRKSISANIDLPYRRAENLLIRATEEIKQNGDGFYWVHLMDPHLPYNPPNLSEQDKIRANILYEAMLVNIKNQQCFTEQETTELIELYNKECTYMDQQINKFIEENPDNLYIITSDHGEMFGENYSYSHGPYYHGMTLQLGHIPFIVYGPGVRQKTITTYHASIDIGSTILDIYNLDEVQGYGRSFKKEIMK